MRGEKIIIADNQPLTVQNEFEFLLRSGHYPLGFAYSLRRLEVLLGDELVREELSVAIVDKRFPRDEDGEAAAGLIRQKSPLAKIIAYTSDDDPGWGDFYANKRHGLQNLLNVLESIHPNSSGASLPSRN